MQKPSELKWTIIDIIQWTSAYFKSRQIDSPRLAAELLLAHVLDIERIELYLRHDQPLLPGELSHFKSLIKRRLSREPLAYILGYKEFWDLRFRVDRSVLIPRPETEFLVEAALGRIKEKEQDCRLRILEPGTGSGAVVVSLAADRPGHLYYASDRDCSALAVAGKNASLHAGSARIFFFAGSWFEPVSQCKGFDLVLCNPPYVPSDDLKELSPEIRLYEPVHALDGGADGLSELKGIINAAPAYLNPGGILLLEIGAGQSRAVKDLLAGASGLEMVRVLKDLGGHDRVVEAVRSS